MSMPHSELGLLTNRELVRDWISDSVAADTLLTKGMATFVDAANGRKPTNDAKAHNLVRVIEVDANNKGGKRGDIKVSTFKGGAIVGMKAGGVISPDAEIESAADGEVVTSTDATKSFGRYIAKPGLAGSVNDDPADCADGDTILVMVY